MKKTTVGLISIFLLLANTNTSWAHPGARIDLGNSGFGFSISEGPDGHSTLRFNTQNFGITTQYPARPYLGWGGYRGYNHTHQRHWGHHHSHHHTHHHHYQGHPHRHKHYKQNNHYRDPNRGKHYRNRGRYWIR